MGEDIEEFLINNETNAMTLLKANSTKEQILNLCDEAIANDFASVCVNPGWVKMCAEKCRLYISGVCCRKKCRICNTRS